MHQTRTSVQYTSLQSLSNQFDEKTMHWKIKLQVASILIRFMWCHFNWKYILYKSDEIIWTWLMFQPLAAAARDSSDALIKTSHYRHTRTHDCDSNCNFSSDCMQATGQWCQVSRARVCSSKLYCSAPCAIELKGWAEKKEFYILHLILHLIVSLHNYDMRGKPVCLYCD